MKIITVTENMNCFWAINQSCRNHNVECKNYTGGVLEVETDDVLIFLEMDPTPIYSKMNCNTINGYYFYYDKPDKYNQYTIINAAGINHIETYTADEIDKLNTIPFVGKPMRGSMGRGVELLYSKHILRPDYIYQPYIPNDGDWRIVVIGGKAVSSIKRKGKGFLNNLAQGADGWTEWDDEASKLAEEAAKALEIEYAGIDIMKDKETGKYYFLECNSSTTFDTSQILTRVDIADELVKYIIKKYGAIE